MSSNLIAVQLLAFDIERNQFAPVCCDGIGDLTFNQVSSDSRVQFPSGVLFPIGLYLETKVALDFVEISWAVTPTLSKLSSSILYVTT